METFKLISKIARLISACEKELNVTLTIGQTRDFMLDNLADDELRSLGIVHAWDCDALMPAINQAQKTL